MHDLSNWEIIEKALSVLKPRELWMGGSAATVACALLSKGRNVYLGVCIDVGSGIGFCAEHSAIAAMMTAGETGIAKIVAVASDGLSNYLVLPPCGRCREFMYEIDQNNILHTQVILAQNHVVKLNELLPYPYHKVWEKQA